MAEKRPALDTAVIARRRVELGMSQRTLAREAGLNAISVSLIEKGQNHAELTLRVVERIADVLGLPLRALMCSAAETDALEPGLDDLRVEAVLTRVGQPIPRERIARLLGWDLNRTVRSLHALAARLEGSAVLLYRASSGYTIRPRGDILSDEEIQAIERVKLRTRQSTEGTMRLLRRVVQEGLPAGWEQHAGNTSRVNLHMLMNSGLVALTQGGYRATPDLMTSLKL